MAARFVRKAAGKLAPGGVLLIHEFSLNDAPDGPEFPALFSPNVLLGIAGGQAYSGAPLRGMSANAGMPGSAKFVFPGPNYAGIGAERRP